MRSGSFCSDCRGTQGRDGSDARAEPGSGSGIDRSGARVEREEQEEYESE